VNQLHLGFELAEDRVGVRFKNERWLPQGSMQQMILR
jgi:hypothetical protein